MMTDAAWIAAAVALVAALCLITFLRARVDSMPALYRIISSLVALAETAGRMPGEDDFERVVPDAADREELIGLGLKYVASCERMLVFYEVCNGKDGRVQDDVRPVLGAMREAVVLAKGVADMVISFKEGDDMAKPENADKGVAKSLLRLAVAHGADAVLAVVDAWKPNKVNADDIKLLELRLNQAREGLLKGGRDETMSGR